MNPAVPGSLTGLTPRTRALLAEHRITTLAQLCDRSWSSIRRLSGCGVKTGQELDALLDRHGFSYRVDQPDDLLVNFLAELTPVYARAGDYRSMGERYGIDADLMYQIFSGLERAARSHAKASAEHDRWASQFGDKEAAA